MLTGDYAKSSFDVIISGTIDCVNHSDALLALLVKLLKVNGDMLIKKDIGPEPNTSKNQFVYQLKTAGFLVVNDGFESVCTIFNHTLISQDRTRVTESLI